MTPSLVAVAGPLKGSVRALTENEISIGRDLANSVAIGDASVSREHSLLTKESGSYRITDRDSLNGTFVNGLPVKERSLRHGDQVQIGTSLFLFLTKEAEGPLSTKGEPPDPGDVRLGSTVRLAPDEALYVDTRRLSSAALPDARTARDLRILLEASRALASARRVEEFARKLLDLALEAVPADRGAVLLREEGSEELSPAAMLGPAPFSVSRTLLSRVLGDGEAILSNEVLGEENLREAGSLVASGVRALVAVPFRSSGGPSGALYLDSRDPARGFDEGELQILMGLTNLAAVVLENIRHMEWLEGERERLGREIGLESDLVGESRRMRDVCDVLARVAPTDSTVLILGETGTGKELAARAVHSNSPRSARPFVAVNCAALTENLLESELFGHERGAFTGAVAQKKGRLEIADGGTVFLDEVAELSPPIQAKLLRVLEERQFERVGGTRAIRVDVRLIAATNKNLEELVSADKFRQDLFYRLDVLSVTMPPLRDRREDIPLLASYFAARYRRKLGRSISGFSPQARACLLRYDWPGNVRELSNAIERAVVLGGSDVIEQDDLPESLLEREKDEGEPEAGYHGAVNAAKRETICRAVEQAGGNITEAARRLNVHPNYLHRLIRNLNLKERLHR